MPKPRVSGLDAGVEEVVGALDVRRVGVLVPRRAETPLARGAAPPRGVIMLERGVASCCGGSGGGCWVRGASGSRGDGTALTIVGGSSSYDRGESFGSAHASSTERPSSDILSKTGCGGGWVLGAGVPSTAPFPKSAVKN